MLTKKDAGIISTIQLKLQQDKFTQLIPVPKFLQLLPLEKLFLKKF